MNLLPDERWTFQIAPTLLAELDELEAIVAQFQAGALTDTQFRAIRVPRGVYEQRENGTYMLRVRFPAGGIIPRHLRRLGEVATRWGNGVLHVTTRQEFQVHRVPLASVVPALRSLAEAGLSTRGGGGNTVRNVTACLDAGVCADEIFDVAPYAIATTERLLSDPASFQLPRKYKIAFAGCERDCSGATVHDVGFIARRQDGIEGFAVYLGGGMGGKSRVASLLHEFIPAGDTFLVAEAVKRVFDQRGDRKNKHLARLRFLVEKIGLDEFRRLYDQELAALRATHPQPLQIRPTPQPRALPDDALSALRAGSTGDEAASAFEGWRRRSVAPQKQPGRFLVHLPLALGDLPAERTAALADLVEAHGEGSLRASQSQNLVLRSVTEPELPELHGKLAALGLAPAEAPVLRNLVACAGASTCRLGICLSRGLAKAVRRELEPLEPTLDDLEDFSIHISGCPNSCGRHPIGNIGFSGAARKVDERPVPYYAVQLGGRVGEGKTRFGVNIGALPARHAPHFVRELLEAWQRSSEAGDFHAFVDNGGREVASEILTRHQTIPPLADRKEFYYDWDADVPFSLAGRGAGECSAGVFDLIEVDLANARESLEAGRLYAATLAAARALLITRSLQPKSDREVFELFQRHFIGGGWVGSGLAAVIDSAALASEGTDPSRAFTGSPGDVTQLVAAIRLLYESLDASLRLKPQAS